MFSIWITNCCNLECKYCYVENNKGNQKFDVKKVESLCKFIIEHNKDEYIRINFFGGEPLLAFDIISEIVCYFERKEINNIIYFITTNGTMINDIIAEFFVSHKVSVSVSLDGEARAHDKNRIYHNGQGSFADALRGLNILKKHNCQGIRIRGTYDSKSVSELIKNAEYLYENYHETVVMVPDYFDKNWGIEDFVLLKKAHEYFKSNEDIMVLDKPACKPTACSGGISDFYIDVNGEVYPCSYVVGNKEYRIGSINEGLEKEKINKLGEINKKRIPECKNCSREFFCRSYKCKYINLKLTGNLLIPSPVLCNIENILSSHQLT